MTDHPSRTLSHARVAPPWRSGSFYPSPRDFRRIARSERDRLMRAVEAFERQTRGARGRATHGGVLGPSAVAVLRALLFKFLSVESGRLDPSYDRIASETGLHRDTVIEAVKRLVAAGLIERTRRIIREFAVVPCPFTGRPLRTARVRQTTNAYKINPYARLDTEAPIIQPRPRPPSPARLIAQPIAESEAASETTTDSFIRDAVRGNNDVIEDARISMAVRRARLAGHIA